MEDWVKFKSINEYKILGTILSVKYQGKEYVGVYDYELGSIRCYLGNGYITISDPETETLITNETICK